jgi:hypothetical protein
LANFKDAIGFSKLDCYRSCPAKFKFQFMDKLPQGSSPAMERGSKLHDDCEAYLRGWVSVLPTELEQWKDAFDDLKALKCKTEESWGFDKDWNKLSDWFQPQTWLRAKSDAHFVSDGVLTIIDFKSGKYRVPSTEQVELYAICGSAIYPEVEDVVAAFWYLDTMQIYDKRYTKAHLKELRKKYEGYFAPIFQDTTWKPSPSRECKWCSYSISKQGPCAF